MNSWIATIPDTPADGSRVSPQASYSYDSPSRSQRQVSAGDLFFLRDQMRLQAIARVERIDIERKEETVQRCPNCGIAKVEFRKTRKIPYRCFHGHQFRTPTETSRAISVYTARFASDYIRVNANIEPAELRPFEFSNGHQLKLRPSDLSGITRYIARRDHVAAAQLKLWLKDRPISLADTDADAPTPSSLPVLDDEDKPFQAIRARRGYMQFRDKLITRYGPRCMISGCTVLALLEACHVNRYRGPSDNHPANGLLLRSDLHTLFDLDLIGLNPDGLQVVLHPRLTGTEYEKFSRTRLSITAGKGPDTRAMHNRWDQFVQKAEQAGKPGPDLA